MLGISALLLVLGYLLIDTGPEPGAESVLPHDPEIASAVDAPPPLESVEPEPLDSRSVVEAPATAERPELSPLRVSARASSPLSPVSPESVGRLRIRAIDSQTGASLDRIQVRALSDTRFADRASDPDSGEVELVLTPDTYTLLVLSPGYEPTELPPVPIERAAVVTLDRVPMRAGSSRILGRVTGDLDPNVRLRVQLLGEGRRPCVSCPNEIDQAGELPSGLPGGWNRKRACPVCGYAEKSSRVRIAASGGFAFTNLVSGLYTLRLIDDQNRTMGLPTSIELRAEDTLSVEIESVRPRVVRLELRDTDGRSLANEWAGRLARRVSAEPEEEPELRFEAPAPSCPPFRCTFHAGELCLAESSFSPPALEEPFVRRPSPFGGRRLGSGPRRERMIDDRARGSSDALRSAPRAPTLEPTSVVSQIDADGLVRFERVPALDLELKIECGPFTATVTVPSSLGVAHVRAQLTLATPTEAGPGPSTFLEYEATFSR